MTDEDRRAVDRMSRQALEELLECYGFAVYDDETTHDLREAVAENVEDGTIPSEDLDWSDLVTREKW